MKKGVAFQNNIIAANSWPPPLISHLSNASLFLKGHTLFHSLAVLDLDQYVHHIVYMCMSIHGLVVCVIIAL